MELDSTTPKEPATSMWRDPSEIYDSAASSSEEDEQQVKNNKLFVAIRKKISETTIIKEIKDLLNSGSEINAFNTRGKTVLDIARQKKYECLEKYLIKRGGKTAIEIEHGPDDVHQNIEVNCTNNHNDILENLNAESELQEEREKLTRFRIDEKQRELDVLLKDGTNNLTQDKLEKLNAKLQSEFQNQEVIEALKRCKVEVNYPDSGIESSAIDIAWKNKYYDAVLMLLEFDSKFPLDFAVDLDKFYENPKIPNKFKTFVREREALHEWIRNDELDKIRKFVTVHKLSFYFNCDNKPALEIAAEFANVNTLASVVGITSPSLELTLSEEQSKLLQQHNPEENTHLSVAAKCGKGDNVAFLIRCGIDVNHTNKFGESAIDLAWDNKHYDVVHILLKADSNFPNQFNLDVLNEANAKDLKQFVEGRNKLHELIKENCLVEIKAFVAHDKSRLYLNSEGKSALATAVLNGRFEIYAFLQSIGLSLTPHEEEYINELPSEDKRVLKTELIRKFPQIEKGHILYLISKSRSKRAVENSLNKIEKLYRDLDEIPEISILMQVLQYIDYLDLVFDFDNELINDINPSVPKCNRGVTEYKDGRIYIGAGADEKTVAGTLAHELAHLAMYLLYENDCNPFDEVGKSRNEFEKITDIIREKLKDTKERRTEKKESVNKDNPETVLAEILFYSKNEHPSELIARVPQILAEYSTEAINLLFSREEFKSLFDYYNNQEAGGLMYRCKKMIENSFLIRPRKCINFLNKTVGKSDEIIKYGMHFEICNDLDIFLKNETQVFLLETESALLSMLNVYDSLIVKNKNYSLQDSLILEFNSYIEKEVEVLHLFDSPALKVLCISYSGESTKEELNKFSNALHSIKYYLNKNAGKKVIFIIQKSETEILSLLTSMFNGNCEKSVQNKFTLNDFTEESQVKLLEREITFQGEIIKLNELINILDDDAKTVIDTNILVKLIKGERMKIGRKPPDASDLEGAFSDSYQEVDINTLVDKVLEQHAREVFIISGISGSKKQDNLINCFLNKTEDINKKIKADALKSHIELLDVQEVSRGISESILITGSQFKAKHFKQICHNNSALKIYWICWKHENDESQLILQRIYNPDFYVTGNRISFEIVIEKSVKELLTSSKLSEKFIIIQNQNSDIEKWFQLNPEQEKRFKNNMQKNNIAVVYSQDDALNYFSECLEANQTVHLLELQHGTLIWHKTNGSLNLLKEHRAIEYRNIKPLLKDNDAIQMIQDKKVSIIAGDPGTGKSTIITWLYNANYSSHSGHEESIIQSHWVIKVNLKDHVATIKSIMRYKSGLSEITEFLLQADKNLSHDESHTLAEGLIGMSLQKKNFVKPLLIIFDGFDEVLNKANRNKIIKFLQYLKDETNAKLCITARLHCQKDLEGALSTFAMKLEPMDCSTIHTFITKSVSNRLSLKLTQDSFTHFFDYGGKRTLKYSNAFLSKIQEVFKKETANFIGTPLQLYLMLENSVDSFLKWMNDSSKNPDFSFLGNDIWEVYENFINKKYDYFSKTKTRLSDEMLNQEYIRLLDKYHRDLAISLIDSMSKLKESSKDIQDIILSVGIVRSEGNHPSFIHPTFAEYFAARTCYYWIRKWKEGRLTNFTKQEYFFKNILQSLDYKLIRAFLNAKLLKEEDTTFYVLKRDYYHKDIVRRAVEENHVGIAKLVFDNIPNVDVNVDNSGEGFLNIAAKAGHLEIVKLLIENGANIEARNWKRQTALSVAAQSGNLEITKGLIDKGANVKAIDKWRQTALHLACRFGYLKIVKLLIEKDADINATDMNGLTALMIAAESGDLEITKLLIEKGANIEAIDMFGETALQLAFRSGNLEIVKLLMDKDADINSTNKKGLTPRTIAAKELLKTALFSACRAGNLEIVKLIIDENASQRTRQTALIIAAQSGEIEITKWLIHEVSDVNAVDNSHRTALFYASRNGYLEIVKFLVENKADVDIEDEDGQTALSAANENGYTEIVALLKTHSLKHLPTAKKRAAGRETFGHCGMVSAKRHKR